MTETTKFGLVLPATHAQLLAGQTARDVVALGVEAERLGLDSLWVGDTLQRAPIDPLTLLGALATATERVTLGTAALLPALHDPLFTANALNTLDLLSEGRVVAAVGAGFAGRSEPEFAMVGVPWEQRRARLDDIVALWRLLWSGENPRSFHGKVLHYDTLPEFPAPHRAGGPPVWLAAFTPKALERAGRLYDGWLPYPPDVSEFARGLAEVRAAAPDPGAVTPALYATVLVEEDPARGRAALEAYTRANYGAPLEFVEKIQVLLSGTPDQLAERLGEYVTAGAQHILIRSATADPQVSRDQLPLLVRSLPR